MTNDLFKLNLITISLKANSRSSGGSSSKTDSSTHLFESFYIWHGRLWYIKYHTVCRLINWDILPNVNINLDDKCEICVKPK